MKLEREKKSVDDTTGGVCRDQAALGQRAGGVLICLSPGPAQLNHMPVTHGLLSLRGHHQGFHWTSWTGSKKVCDYGWLTAPAASTATKIRIGRRGVVATAFEFGGYEYHSSCPGLHSITGELALSVPAPRIFPLSTKHLIQPEHLIHPRLIAVLPLPRFAIYLPPPVSSSPSS
jgi:hypothetical protein